MSSLEIPGFTDSQEQECCPTLSWKQRIIGFCIMLGIGIILGIVAWVAVFNENWTLFGIMITFSNVAAIGGSLFLSGPKTQAKKMFEEKRWVATLIFLIMMILTLVMALAVKSGVGTIIFCILQYLALIWYSLSYIPGAHTVIKKMVGL